jgi:hypothetical protein
MSVEYTYILEESKIDFLRWLLNRKKAWYTTSWYISYTVTLLTPHGQLSNIPNTKSHLESIYTKILKYTLIYDTLLVYSMLCKYYECWVGVYCNIWKRKECNPRLASRLLASDAYYLEIYCSSLRWKHEQQILLKIGSLRMRWKEPRSKKKTPDSLRFLNINGITGYIHLVTISILDIFLPFWTMILLVVLPISRANRLVQSLKPESWFTIHILACVRRGAEEETADNGD